MTVDVKAEAGDLTADRARLTSLRRSLGAQLATYRMAAGVSQPELGHAVGRTRSTISKIEHGTRGMPARLWKITDEVCHADGALVAEHSALANAEQDYRARGRRLRPAAYAEARARSASSPAARHRDQDVAWQERTRVSGELAKELMAVVTKLIRLLGRRNAIRMISGTLAAVGLSGLDADEYTRLAQAVAAPHRVDAHVVENLAVTLTSCKRLEDKLGPCEVLDTVVAQYELVRHLLTGGCPENLVKPLKLVESDMASAIGGYLIDMNRPAAARGYFQHARRAGHHAGNPACAAYAAANASLAAFLRGDTPTALDTAAAARSLAARTDDARLKALAEQMAAAAYALDGQYRPCMAGCARAHDFLASANGGAANSLAYWVHEGKLDSQRSLFLCLLDKPRDAVNAASNARDRFNRTFVGGYGHCQVQLSHALVLDKEINEAAHVLGDAAGYARLSPLLTQELHTTRALMRSWENTKAVQELDARLHAYGLLPTAESL